MAATEPARAPAPAGPPCFPDGPPLDGRAVYERLQRHAMAAFGPEDEAPPPEPFGTCTVTRGILRAADGTAVGELGCGLRILVPGIRDDLGLELGARGQDVLDRRPAPRTRLVCHGNGPGQARCNFERADDADLDGTAYVVAVDGDLAEPLVGPAAEAFFAPRRLVEIQLSVWCH